jgi:hypothetical protein
MLRLSFVLVAREEKFAWTELVVKPNLAKEVATTYFPKVQGLRIW